jgi:quercetin dioxygenase-like cupin family protein
MTAVESKAPGAQPYLRRHGEDAVWFMGALFTFLADGDDTEGRFALIETVGRQGLEVPPHTHEREDEAYYVVEGEMRFLVGGRSFEVGPGDFVYLPRNIEHSWKIKTPTAKTLVLIAPAGLEAGFKEMSKPAETPTLPPGPEEPPDIERMLAVFGALGVRFALPPSER